MTIDPKTEDALTKVSKGGFADFLPDVRGWLPPHIAKSLGVNTGNPKMPTKPHCPSLQDGCDSPATCNAEGVCHYTGTALDPHTNREVFPGVPRVDDVFVPPADPTPDAGLSALRISEKNSSIGSLAERIAATVDSVLEVRRLSVSSEDRVKAVMEGMLGLTYTELMEYADRVWRRANGTNGRQESVALALTESAKVKLDMLAAAKKPTE